MTTSRTPHIIAAGTGVTGGGSGAGQPVAPRRMVRQPLRAHLEYEPDGTLRFRLSGHEEHRFREVLADFRRAVHPADREWEPGREAWLLYGGWDEELLEILEDHFEPEEVFVDGRPLREDDDE